MHVCFVLFPLFDLYFVDFPSVLRYCWLGLLTCKNRLPYNLYCVGGDVKHGTIQYNPIQYSSINCTAYTDQFIDFDIIRQNFYTASNLKDLFHNIHPKCIFSFVHAIGLTNKL